MEQIVASQGAREMPLTSRRVRPVGIVGFGLLGEAFARRLCAAGRAVVAWDPEPERRARMELVGVTPAGGAGAIAARTCCVLLAVYDAEQAAAGLRELADGTPRGESLQVLCTTTLAPRDARALARVYAGGTLRFIEMPVSGSSRQVLEGGALALLGTQEALPPQVQEVIDAVCPKQVCLSGEGAPAAMKLVINLVLEINRAALAEGITLARHFGLDLAATEQALRGSAASSRLMEHQAPTMRQGTFQQPVARLAQSLKDMREMLAEGRGRFLPVATAASELLACCVRSGEGTLDSAAIVLELERRAARALGNMRC